MLSLCHIFIGCCFCLSGTVGQISNQLEMYRSICDYIAMFLSRARRAHAVSCALGFTTLKGGHLYKYTVFLQSKKVLSLTNTMNILTLLSLECQLQRQQKQRYLKSTCLKGTIKILPRFLQVSFNYIELFRIPFPKCVCVCAETVLKLCLNGKAHTVFRHGCSHSL